MQFGSPTIAPIIIDESPTIEEREGLFYITFEAIGLCLASRPATFIQTFQAMAGALQQHYSTVRDDADVIVFPRSAH